MSNKLNTLYYEDTLEENGVVHIWNNVTIEESFVTQRGTKVDIIHRPGWGLACYMDNSIQSCEVDEKVYHEALVHPVMFSSGSHENICIIGGGEGATLREVLKWKSVKHVDMYEWDPEVVHLFKTKYQQWAKDAWDDPRLIIHYVDIFKRILEPVEKKYDVIIIDLFDPDELNIGQWKILIKMLSQWLSSVGSIVMYAGMRQIPGRDSSYTKLQSIIEDYLPYYTTQLDDCIMEKDIIPYKVYIPSFSGESTFIILKDAQYNINIPKYTSDGFTHITPSIWTSYKTMNY